MLKALFKKSHITAFQRSRYRYSAFQLKNSRFLASVFLGLQIAQFLSERKMAELIHTKQALVYPSILYSYCYLILKSYSLLFHATLKINLSRHIQLVQGKVRRWPYTLTDIRKAGAYF